jgi:AraC-like DNA-binding protein
MDHEYFDLRKFIANQPIDKELFKYKENLYPIEKLGLTVRKSSIYTYILDWQEATYSFLSRGIRELTGYNDDKIKLGIETLFQVIHPDDADPLQRMISKWMGVLLGKPEDEFNRYTANFNFRIKKHDGVYINLLQQPVYVSFDKKGNIVYEAGILTDISRYKNDGNMSLLILDPDHIPLIEYYPKEDFMPHIGVIRQQILNLERLLLSTDKSWYRKVQKVINENISNENLDVEMICQELKISRSKFYRKLREIDGLKPGQLIKTYRLLGALSMLSVQDLSISEIAWKTGFQSHSYFSSCFRDHFGCTPTQYRVQVT